MEIGAGAWWASTGILVLFGLWRNQVNLGERLSLSAAVQYFDFPGSEPFVSELAAAAKLGEAKLKIGKFPITWGDGLIYHDLWTGTEGALFFWRGLELGAIKPRGRWLGVFKWQGLGLAGDGSKLWLWAELGGERAKAEAALNSNGEWATLWRLKKLPLGAALLAFSESWENLGGFPIIFDDFYNGWTGLGDAFTWAAMTDSAIAPTVSSASGGDLGVLWPDMRNLVAWNLNFSAGPLRLDWFYISPLESQRTWAGHELSANLVLRRGAVSGGAGGGVFKETKGHLGTFWVLRLWGQASLKVL